MHVLTRTGYFVSLPRDRRILLSRSIHQDALDRIQRAGITVMAFAHYAALCEAQARHQPPRRDRDRDVRYGALMGHEDGPIVDNGSISGTGGGYGDGSRSGMAQGNGHKTEKTQSAHANGVDGMDGHNEREVIDTSREAYREWDRRALKVAAFARQALEGSHRAPGDNLGPILDLRTAFVS